MTAAARPLCAAPTCRARGHHATNCPGDCAGCLPRLAADGLRLCTAHVEWLGADAVQLAELHAELAERLMPGGAAGERVDRSETWRTPDPRAVAARSDIRATLASWCRLVAEERGLALPADEVDAMGAYVARHAEWLAAHPAAGDASDELSSLARHAWRVCYPSGARVAQIGPCPVAGCAGILRSVVHPADVLLPAQIACDGVVPHRWAPDAWHALGRAMRRAA